MRKKADNSLVNTSEMVRAILELRVLAITGLVIETSPAFDLVGIGYVLCAVIWVDLLHHKRLSEVSARLVIEDCINIDNDTSFFGSLDEILELFFRSPASPLAAFSIEFTQVVKIVCIIACVDLSLAKFQSARY